MHHHRPAHHTTISLLRTDPCGSSNKSLTLKLFTRSTRVLSSIPVIKVSWKHWIDGVQVGLTATLPMSPCSLCLSIAPALLAFFFYCREQNAEYSLVRSLQLSTVFSSSPLDFKLSIHSSWYRVRSEKSFCFSSVKTVLFPNGSRPPYICMYAHIFAK